MSRHPLHPRRTARVAPAAAAPRGLSALRERLVFVVAAALVLALSMVTAGSATTGDSLKEGQRNGTATAETQIISAVTGEAYGTRQSNTSTGDDAGGAAIYGCRRPSKECTRHVNLSTGPAAAFVTTGTVPFTISASATGLVTGLNADQVDGKSADDIVAQALAGKAASATTADTATSATSADTATSATTAQNVSGRVAQQPLQFVSSSSSDASEATARSGATEVKLDAVGPFTVYGKCFVDTDGGAVGGPKAYAEVYVRTSRDGAMLDGDGVVLAGGPFLDTTTAETDRVLQTSSVSLLDTATLNGDAKTTMLVAPDGVAVSYHVVTAVKQGALSGGNGAYGAGTRCAFSIARNA